MSSAPLSPRGEASNASFVEALNKNFPGTQRESAFIAKVAEELNPLGFTKDSTIACVGVCRDEFCDTMDEEVLKHFGEAFSLRGLGGFIFCGKTGFGAAHHHSPIDSEGRERYLYIVAPHIGIASDGTLGTVNRPNRDGASSACGALCGLQGLINAGKLDTDLQLDDVEMSIVKQLVAAKIQGGEQPDIVKLTNIAAQCIIEQLEDNIKKTVNTEKADYAVIAGVQIHGPGNCQNYFVPCADSCYAVVKGEKTQLQLSDNSTKASTK